MKRLPDALPNKRLKLAAPVPNDSDAVLNSGVLGFHS